MGNAFIKNNVESFFRSAGVSRELAQKYKDEAKYVWARKVLNDLENFEDGKVIQRKITNSTIIL